MNKVAKPPVIRYWVLGIGKKGEIALKKTVLLFPGQGSQGVGMGQEFYQEYDVVREIFDMAAETVKMGIANLCFKGPMEALTQTVNLQPAVTTR